MKTNAHRQTQLTILIGSLFAAPAALALPVWTGGGGSSNWTTGLNWSTGVPPGLADTAIFGIGGSGGSNVVNQDFTVGGVSYGENSTHMTSVSSGKQLQVRGPASIGVGDPTNRATVTWGGGGQVSIGASGAAQAFWVGVNNSAAGSGTTTGMLSLQDISVGGFIGELSIGRKTIIGGSVASNADGSLVLASNSSLIVGSAASRANIYIGLNSQNAGSAVGLLDARQGTVDIHANDFSVGFSSSPSGLAVGTLRWNNASTIDTNALYFSRGVGSGVLDLAPGAKFSVRTGALGIAYNDSASASGTALSHLDMTVNNPSFAAVVTGELSIGRKTIIGGSVASNADGSLVLASNSSLIVGSAASRANIYIGLNQQALGSVVGLLDARQGHFDAFASTVNLGSSSGGVAKGSLTTGAQTHIDAQQINIGTGANAAGTFNLAAGTVKSQFITLDSGGAFNFTGGRLSVGTFNGALNQDGGVLAPGSSPGISTINGGYTLASAGALEIELNGTVAGTQYDRVVVKGPVVLNSDAGLGGQLALRVGFTSHIGDGFLILDNDGIDAIQGHFRGLSEGTQFSEMLGGYAYRFQISYLGGTGNDVTLTTTGVTAVPEPEPGR